MDLQEEASSIIKRREKVQGSVSGKQSTHSRRGLIMMRFSLVVRHTSIKVVLTLVASWDMHLEHMDVKTAFLHGDLEEQIYIDQSEGFTQSGKEHLVCKLKRSLYGLKQTLRQWYKWFDSYMI